MKKYLFWLLVIVLLNLFSIQVSGAESMILDCKKTMRQVLKSKYGITLPKLEARNYSTKFNNRYRNLEVIYGELPAEFKVGNPSTALWGIGQSPRNDPGDQIHYYFSNQCK